MIQRDYQKPDKIMTPVQFSALFTSVDEMAEKTGFDFDFCQLERGEPILKSCTTILPSVFSTTFYFNKRFHQKGKAPEGYASVGIMLGDSRTRSTGKNYGSEYLFDFNSRCWMFFNIESEQVFPVSI